MIVFVAHSTTGIAVYLRTYGAPIADLFRVCSYDELFRARHRPTGTYVFADMERLTDEERVRAGAICDELIASGARVLNHPLRSMRRYGLLQMLGARGTNHFDVWRADEPKREHWFPVFVRGENDHRGSRTPLLHTPEELETAIADLRASGHSGDNLVVEFLDTSDQDGWFRKYGAFVIGDRVLPRHLFVSNDWLVKGFDRVDDRVLREELEYISTNPHAEVIREVAAAANISYGRIDYSLLDGEVQVWEFNTNPMIAGRWLPRPKTTTRRGAAVKRVRQLARPAIRRFPFLRGAYEARLPLDQTPRERAASHAEFAAGLIEAWTELASH